MNTRWLDKYLHIPFVDRGRDEAGCDCWGLVCLVLKDAGVDVPTFEQTSFVDGEGVCRHIDEEIGEGCWDIVDGPPKIFDVAIMLGRTITSNGPVLLPCHIGIVPADNKLLHTERGKNSVLIDLNNPTVKNRIVGMYRHKAFSR